MADVSTARGADTEVPDTSTSPVPSPPARQQGPSMRPALLVLGLAVVILGLFGIGSALWGSGSNTARQPAAARVPGTSLVAVAARGALAPILQPGSPPANVVDALTIPRGAVAGTSIDYSADAGQYDEAVRFTMATSEEAMITFYRTELSRLGWHISSTGTPTGQPGMEILAEKSGDDGWQWEAGAVISPTTFGASATGTTPFTLRLFQVPDGN